MANQTNTDPNAEIDLSQVAARARRYVSGVNDSFFDGILFIKRNIIIIAILILGGAGLGYYMDQTSESYVNKIIVTPNFDSVDYLYEAVDQLQAKIQERDTMYLKSLGIHSPKNISKIEIKPLIDIYNYIDEYDSDNANSTTNRKFEVLELMADGGDIKEIVEEPATSKNYRNHGIIIKAKKKADLSGLVEPIMKYLNSNPYYEEIRQAKLNNVVLKMAQNDTIIHQLDKMFAYITNPARSAGGTVYYNDNTQLSDAMRLKENILQQQGKLRLDKVNFTNVIKENGKLLNQKVTGGTNGIMKFILPLLLIALFVIFMIFRSYYRSQVEKRKIIITNE